QLQLPLLRRGSRRLRLLLPREVSRDLGTPETPGLLALARFSIPGEYFSEISEVLGALPLLRGPRKSHGVRIRSAQVISLLYRAADLIRRRRYPNDHGRIGEDLAHRYLQKHGCTVVARNYRPPSGPGEIDLVAWDGESLAFVEVKTRATAEFGAPESAVD